MLNQLHALDIVVFVILLLAVPVSSVLAGLRKRNTEDYFMAGRSLRWWAVAGSVFGTNINSSHLIGMLGIGYSIGFAQSHYEILAVPAILLLCYVFLPVYRRLRVFTLSQFLEHRYNPQARLAYSVLMILLILVQLVAAFYIGSRTLGLLFRGSGFEIGYAQGLLVIAGITCSYTIFGGLSSVVVADNFQTVMMLAAGVAVALLTFWQPEIGGLGGLLELERNLPPESRKMHLYLPADHPALPWSGAFTGLLGLQFFYWTTNQYLVQRTLAAETDRQAKLGVIASGFLKLTVPFFSIATGVAAAYLFQSRYGTASVLPDDAFLRLVETVVPAGTGLAGFILAGLTAATFSSVDSMMNSVTTLLTMDVYQKYLRPQATEREMVRFGRLAIVGMVAVTACLAWLTYEPRSAGNFFLRVSAQGSYLTPGVVVAFFLGMVWRRANGVSAVVVMLLTPLLSIGIEQGYAGLAAQWAGLQVVFGAQLNFLHRVAATLLCCTGLHVGLSLLLNKPAAEPPPLAGLPPLRGAGRTLAGLALAHAGLVALAWGHAATPAMLAPVAALVTLAPFVWRAARTAETPLPHALLHDDRLYAGLLSAATAWILYAFA